MLEVEEGTLILLSDEVGSWKYRAPKVNLLVAKNGSTAVFEGERRKAENCELLATATGVNWAYQIKDKYFEYAQEPKEENEFIKFSDEQIFNEAVRRGLIPNQ